MSVAISSHIIQQEEAGAAASILGAISGYKRRTLASSELDGYHKASNPNPNPNPDPSSELDGYHKASASSIQALMRGRVSRDPTDGVSARVAIEALEAAARLQGSMRSHSRIGLGLSE